MQNEQAAAGAHQATWMVALAALAVFAALSEGAYLGFGLAAKACLSSTDCGGFTGALSRTFFALAEGPDGAPRLYNILTFGLPGLNNLFYTFINPSDPGEMPKFLQTVAISLLVGFMMVAGFLATARGRSTALKLPLAAGFAFGWFLVYNNAELSIYGGELSTLQTRLAEIPIATVALLCLLPWTRNRTA